jgi:hypothetical protein
MRFLSSSQLLLYREAISGVDELHSDAAEAV